jgi:hypothetical protein
MTIQLSPARFGTPPPLQFDLIDAGRTVGWVAGDTVGFRGFSNETEAAHAAWVAHRAIARRLARRNGARPLPIDTEPLALEWRNGRQVVLASGRAIASLVRLTAKSRRGADSLGFEIHIPSAVGELEIRAKAYLIYRTLRKSGIRWALWRPTADASSTLATRAQSWVDQPDQGGLP